MNQYLKQMLLAFGLLLLLGGFQHAKARMIEQPDDIAATSEPALDVRVIEQSVLTTDSGNRAIYNTIEQTYQGTVSKYFLTIPFKTCMQKNGVAFYLKAERDDAAVIYYHHRGSTGFDTIIDYICTDFFSK